MVTCGSGAWGLVVTHVGRRMLLDRTPRQCSMPRHTRGFQGRPSLCVFYYEQQIKREPKRIHISGCRCNGGTGTPAVSLDELFELNREISLAGYYCKAVITARLFGRKQSMQNRAPAYVRTGLLVLLLATQLGVLEGLSCYTYRSATEECVAARNNVWRHLRWE